MFHAKRVLLAGGAACALLLPVAHGQSEGYYSRDKYVAVTQRPQPDFDPVPVRLGVFQINASAEADVLSSDNIFVLSDDEEEGVIGSVALRASGATMWSANALSFDVLAKRSEYPDQRDESNNQLRAALGGRLDISRSLSLSASVFAEDKVEARTDLTNTFSPDKPIGISTLGGGIDLNYVNDRVLWRNQLNLRDENFEDGRQALTGLAIDQDYRDRLTLNARTRLAYALSPNFAVFGQAALEERSYDTLQFIDGASRSRDAQSYALSAGIDFELPLLIRGDISVGYLNETKKDSFFEEFSGVSFDGQAEWFPTQLTTVTFNAGRSIVDIGLFNAPTAVETRLGARVDHELLRNVLLSARLTGINQDFEEIDRSDDRIELGAGATYRMSQRVHLNAFLDYSDRDASGGDDSDQLSYKVTTLGAGIRIFP